MCLWVPEAIYHSWGLWNKKHHPGKRGWKKMVVKMPYGCIWYVHVFFFKNLYIYIYTSKFVHISNNFDIYGNSKTTIMGTNQVTVSGVCRNGGFSLNKKILGQSMYCLLPPKPVPKWYCHVCRSRIHVLGKTQPHREKIKITLKNDKHVEPFCQLECFGLRFLYGLPKAVKMPHEHCVSM